ncbi:MAG: TerB family tellurite resistance protein [Maribacter sp.]|nr:TerB family tellurite resistance protein [Maribacter sp.]
MEYNLTEKLAIIKAMEEVILADGQIENSELDIMSELMRILRFDNSLIKESRDITEKEYKTILKEMPKNKKHALTVLLNEIGGADGKLNKKERKLIDKILKKAKAK